MRIAPRASFGRCKILPCSKIPTVDLLALYIALSGRIRKRGQLSLAPCLFIMKFD